ncbi:GAF domain-containing sensor histidine kinase, partial [Variovorax rhizosphaerae]
EQALAIAVGSSHRRFPLHRSDELDLGSRRPVFQRPANPQPMPLSQSIARDIESVGRISAVPSILHIVCENTGMGFAAVARVDDDSWTACAVFDKINFGLRPGGQLDVHSTLCVESRALRAPIGFDHASEHPVYCKHHTPRLYSIESYISVPIIKSDGTYFGNLCAIDPAPHEVSNVKTVSLFTGFASLIAHMLELEDKHGVTESALLDATATVQLRDQFIAVLGHALRNPLASLSATGEILARRSSDPEVLRAAQRIRSTTSRMANLISDVMDFARGRIDGGLDAAFGNIGDLGDAFADVVSELRLAHPSKTTNQDLKITVPVYGTGADCSRWSPTCSAMRFPTGPSTGRST